jgi:hypothetical protein
MAIAHPLDLRSQMVAKPDDRRVCPAEDAVRIGDADAENAPVRTAPAARSTTIWPRAADQRRTLS